ncbi:amidohydrolase [Blastopirellula sp. JC732]|uniref:Amidohydrolase n=1 Tax=Blastopirellula sediminis TaxID=2894196 RepID=A0A9X1MKW5_9BACT|nr:amidohydrolase [Blastopirellula sediminis]MCC9607659.1 amidohydrolase [Blastopirellula sediminis]MCC9629048.1 amidohydrolase [Blastopirellula sediminis]
MIERAWQSELAALISAQEPKWIEFRRRLHQNPEPSGHEYQTSLAIYQELNSLGIELRMGPEGRGVLAEWRTPHAESLPQAIALRGDIDALRIHDQKDVPYRSQCPGLMHACGHDAHATMALWATSLVVELDRAGALPWPVRLRTIFQPAEETCVGALEMISVGALKEVREIYATHVDPSLPTGRIGLRVGALTASCDAVRIMIHGQGGHGARPHESRDPIAAAAQLINALYLSIPRVTDSQDAVVLSFGKIHGGENLNVIPEQVELFGTLRTLDLKVRQRTIDHIHRIIEGVQRATDTTIEVRFDVGTSAVINQAGSITHLKTAIVEAFGHEAIYEIPRASMGGEDFAFYLEHVPGAMARLGCRPPAAERAPLLHSALFDIDEAVLAIGARMMASAVIHAFEPKD